tara:strand:+ start:2122 stop:2256 length:135 start_codon:yes stop_codon:yes gene_type:complete
MNAEKMLVLTNMLGKIISEIDDIKEMIIEMKMHEVESKGFMEEE